MKNLVVVGALALLCAAVPVHAGLDLGWNNCATDGGVTDIVFPCAGSASVELYGSFQLENPVSQFIALDFSLDIQTATTPSGDFWNFGAGECNNGNLVLDDARLADCVSTAPTMCLATGAQCQSGFAWASQFLGPSRHRLVGSLFRDATFPVTLAASTSYFAFKFTFLTSGAVEGGSGTCTGCTDEAAVVWNSALASGFSVRAGTETQEEPIEGPGLVGNCATINGATFLCGEVSSENRTWGQIKSFYR